MSSPVLKSFLDSNNINIFTNDSINIAQDLLNHFFSKTPFQNINERDYYISSLIIAEMINNSSNVSLNEILITFNSSMSKIIKILDSFTQIITDKSISSQLSLLCRDTIYFLMFITKYDKIFNSIFDNDITDKDNLYYFGWLFFIHNKNHFLVNNPHDYERNLYIFLCSLSLLYTIYPYKKNDIINSDTMIVDTNNKQITLSNVDNIFITSISSIIKYLCDNESINYLNVNEFFQNTFYPYIISIKFLVPQNSIKDWITSDNIKINITALSKEEENIQPFRLDFRDISRETISQSIESPIRQSKKDLLSDFNTVCPSSNKQINQSILPENQSKLQIKQSQNILFSPSKISPNDVKTWLENLLPIDNISEISPSLNLKRFLDVCIQDPRPAMKERFKLLENIISLDNQKRIQLLYYRLLDAMLSEEEQRLKKQDFSILLHHDVFHHSLLACCLEVIAFVYNDSSIMYPVSVNLFKVTTFEVSKLIDNVIRYEKTIPLPLKMYLKKIDTQILENSLWKTNSPIFDYIERGGKTQPKYLYQRLSQRIFKRNDAEVLARSQLYSPARKLSHNTSNTNTPTSSVSLEIILRKVFDILYHRLTQLLNALNLQDILDLSTKVSIQILTYNYKLLENRHLDQIIICTIYAVAKAKLIELTFKKILEKYTSPEYNPKQKPDTSIWKSVLIRNNERKDIITFYNEIYIREMEVQIIQLQKQPIQVQVLNDASNASLISSPVSIRTVKSPLQDIKGTPSRYMRHNVGQSPRNELSQFQSSSNNRKRSARVLFPEDDENPTKKQKTTLHPELSDAITSLSNNSLTSPSILRKSK